ncbi:MAG: SDR family oxidoreductase [Myxococcales bacterium]|nr:SDR family oxidoreductase [Myxococcales bacterium]
MAFALITGASAGIGRELAHLFARDGHDVVLVARSKDKLEALAAELRGAHGRTAHVVPTDLADPAAPTAIFAAVQTLGAEVEFLVNNAGFGTHGPFVELDPERELAMVQVNIAALLHLSRLFLPGMVARGRGRVLNVASTAGFQAGPLMATYYATKAFVISFSEAIAHELEGTGVTVTAHCPGATATDFAQTAGNDVSRLFQGGTKVASAREVAEHAYHAMMRGKTLAIHGLMNRIGAFSVRLSPRAVVTSIAGRLNARAE